MACKKRYVVELGKPCCAPDEEKTLKRYTAIETRRRNSDTELGRNLTSMTTELDSGRSSQDGYTQAGCLIRHSTQSTGEP